MGRSPTSLRIWRVQIGKPLSTDCSISSVMVGQLECPSDVDNEVSDDISKSLEATCSNELAQIHHDEIEQEETEEVPYPYNHREPLTPQVEEALQKLATIAQQPCDQETLMEASQPEQPKKQDAFIGKAPAIEVLCPHCGNGCADPKTGSLMVTEDLLGHTVTCVECHTESLVPLNAFTRTGNVTARDKPTLSGPNNKAEKRGRTAKPRKSNAGRKSKSGVVRQPRQFSLDVRTIKTLDAMNVNNSDLFETLLQQYEPFLDTWAEMSYGSCQEDEEE